MTTRRDLRRRARATTGPVFTADLICTACGALCEARYRKPPVQFRCAVCGELAAIRAGDDDEPYPPAPSALPM